MRCGPGRSARLAALTSGGAIPEIGDFRVVLEPDDLFVGTVNEDWATESMAGDIFLLGTHAWQIRQVGSGVVRVADAEGKPPTIPFWTGEAPARTPELSGEISALRSAVDTFVTAGDADGARAWLAEEAGLDEASATQLVDYIAAGKAVLGVVPTGTDLVFERFFDDAEGMHLVVHSPLGGRINRALGLALRKRFCVSFDFELQAAANDDAVVLSLGPHHSFPLDDVPRFLNSKTVREVLEQAVLSPPSPMFTSRWRWNLNRALIVLRFKGGRRNPPPLQRMEADDFMAALFPQAAACQENVAGPVQIPDHPIVRQTMHDTMTEALDIDGLVALLDGIESGRVGGPLPRHHRGVGLRPRDPHRQALRLPRRRRGRRPPHQRRAAAAGPARRPVEHRPARPRGHRPGAGGGHTRPEDGRRPPRPVAEPGGHPRPSCVASDVRRAGRPQPGAARTSARTASSGGGRPSRRRRPTRWSIELVGPATGQPATRSSRWRRRCCAGISTCPGR